MADSGVPRSLVATLEGKPSRIIRVSELVYRALASLGRPLNDTPDSVLRRVLNLPEREKRKRKDENP